MGDQRGLQGLTVKTSRAPDCGKHSCPLMGKSFQSRPVQADYIYPPVLGNVIDRCKCNLFFTLCGAQPVTGPHSPPPRHAGGFCIFQGIWLLVNKAEKRTSPFKHQQAGFPVTQLQEWSQV